MSKFGAKLQVAYLRPSTRKVCGLKCGVCEKPLGFRNKISLCHSHYMIERELNIKEQKKGDEK